MAGAKTSGAVAGGPSGGSGAPASGVPAGSGTEGGGPRGGTSRPGSPALGLQVPLTSGEGRPVVYRLRVAAPGSSPLAGSVTFRIDGRPVRGCSAVRLGGGRTLEVTCRLPDGLATPGYQVVTAHFSGGGGYGAASATAIEQITPGVTGAWLVARDGATWPVGDVPALGAAHLGAPAVAAAATPDGRGLWVLDGDGAVTTLGDARAAGGGPPTLAPYVGLAPTRDGGGYWLLARDGTVVARGDARRLGGAPQGGANGPFVAIAATPDGGGYWLLSAAGNVVSRGDAPRLPPAATPAPPGPYVGIAPSADGRGYTLATAGGHLVRVGDAPAVPPTMPGDNGGGGGIIGVLRLAGHLGWWVASRSGQLLPVRGAPPPTHRLPRPAGPFVALAGT
ncbi:MAG: hypothetical protein M0T71_02910 [Actinomycetota bacterium]|nr:hypothetical protein [Actinomycetota bacterium]